MRLPISSAVRNKAESLLVKDAVLRGRDVKQLERLSDGRTADREVIAEVVAKQALRGNATTSALRSYQDLVDIQEFPSLNKVMDSWPKGTIKVA